MFVGHSEGGVSFVFVGHSEKDVSFLCYSVKEVWLCLSVPVKKVEEGVACEPVSHHVGGESGCGLWDFQESWYIPITPYKGDEGQRRRGLCSCQPQRRGLSACLYLFVIILS